MLTGSQEMIQIPTNGDVETSMTLSRYDYLILIESLELFQCEKQKRHETESASYIESKKLLKEYREQLKGMA